MLQKTLIIVNMQLNFRGQYGPAQKLCRVSLGYMFSNSFSTFFSHFISAPQLNSTHMHHWAPISHPRSSAKPQPGLQSTLPGSRCPGSPRSPSQPLSPAPPSRALRCPRPLQPLSTHHPGTTSSRNVPRGTGDGSLSRQEGTGEQRWRHGPSPAGQAPPAHPRLPSDAQHARPCLQGLFYKQNTSTINQAVYH